jgi:hypothetical protein
MAGFFTSLDFCMHFAGGDLQSDAMDFFTLGDDLGR